MQIRQLNILMDAYYHEDFVEEGGLLGAADLYLAESSRAEINALAVELREILNAGLSDTALGDYLHSLGSYVYRGDDPDGYHSWLQEIARKVDAAC